MGTELGVCPFLEENTEEGKRWSCQLRRENGSWAAAIRDRRYKPIGKHFKQFGYDCESYQCKECGQVERGEMTEIEFLELRNK